jgi:uncharacterized protein YcbX
MAHIAEIYRYPVKGLSGEPQQRVSVPVGEVIPYDRAFTIENGPSGFNPELPEHVPKIAFLMLMRNERLAELHTRFDDTTHVLTIQRNAEVVAEGRLDTEEGRRTIDRFFEVFSAADLRGPPRILVAPTGYSFSDTRGPPKKVLSVINLASVRGIGEVVEAEVNPLRFRGNLYVADLPAWEEFEWVGKQVVVGDLLCEVTKRIDRCAAVNVDPFTGVRDLNIVKTMMKAFNHIDCGVYLKVLAGGDVAVGDTIALAPSPVQTA